MVFGVRGRLAVECDGWAKLIRRVYEVDPLLCPFCGAEMKILAFILDFAAAGAIRKSLGLPAQEPEPLAHAPPETFELVAESAIGREQQRIAAILSLPATSGAWEVAADGHAEPDKPVLR